MGRERERERGGGMCFGMMRSLDGDGFCVFFFGGNKLYDVSLVSWFFFAGECYYKDPLCLRFDSRTSLNDIKNPRESCDCFHSKGLTLLSLLIELADVSIFVARCVGVKV